MSQQPKIVVLDRLQTGESANPSPERILSGKWRIRYTEHELCVLFEGRVRIESISGEKHEFRAGDAFVVPAGFEGTWEVVEPCKKWYAVFEAASSDGG
jgi:hypothetical protein